MKCESVAELLCASLDGALTPAEEKLLQAHVEECPRCRALQAELMGIHTACGELDAAVPAELKERILNALPSQKAAKSRHWQRWGAMAAALAIIAMAAWRLPHQLDQGASDVRPPAGAPTAEAAVEPLSGEMVHATGAHEFKGYDDDTVADEIPPYVDGEGVNVNAYVPSAATTTAGTGEVAEAAIYETSLDKDEPSAAKLFSKKAKTSAQSDLAESVDTDGETGVAVQGNADAGAEATPVSYGSRMAVSGAGNGSATGGVDTAVAEVAPITNEGEWPVAAEPLEPVVETADAFAVYCGVLTLDVYQPEAEYPTLLLENGDIWYSLPAQDFAALIEALDEAGQPYELRLSGDGISPDAPEGLVVVPPQTP